MNIPDKIELYLENRLSLREKALFESEMLVNPALAEEVEKRREVVNSISECLVYNTLFTDKNDKKRFTRQQEISMEEDIIAFQKDYDGNNRQKVNSLKKIIRDVIDSNDNLLREVNPIYRLAISLLFFILVTGSVSYYLYQLNKIKSENATHLAAYFFNPEQDGFLRQLILDTEVQRNKIEMNLADNVPNEEYSNNLLLIEAVSDLSNNETQKAKSKLQLLLSHDAEGIEPSVLWYYAISNAREGNYRETSRLLAKITPLTYYYSASADSLLNLLNKNR